MGRCLHKYRIVNQNYFVRKSYYLADTAFELTKTPSGYKSGESTVNMDFNRWEVIPYMRLDDTSTSNWWMVDPQMMKEDLLWIDRIAVEAKNEVDFETYQTKQAVYGRFGYGWINWRWVYGHDVT